MKAVMISIKPQWCEKIIRGTKTIEIRKQKPKLQPPFKCYIYCTQSRVAYGSFGVNGKAQECGKTVIGEFICNKVSRYSTFADPECDEITTDEILSRSCVSPDMLRRYELQADYHIGLYAWDITDVVIYDTPKELSDFKQCHRCELHEGCRQHEYSCDGSYNLNKPPQSWCYVEEI